MLSEYLNTNAYQLLVDKVQGEYIVNSVLSEIDTRADSRIDQRPIKAVVYSSSSTNLNLVAEQIYGNDKIAPENIAEMVGENSQQTVEDMSVELSRFRNGCRQGRNCPICNGWNDLNENTCKNILLEVSDSSEARFLVERERVVRADGEPLSIYRNWVVEEVLEVCIRDPHPLLPARWTDEVWKGYGSQKCLQMASKDGYKGKDWYFGPLPNCKSSDKRIVTLQKLQRCHEFHSRSRWYRGPQLVDAPIKRVKEDVFILCLHSGLSHGLDLSFVTHIFLLEPIDDAALLEQVTSRAHRLGATGPVVVETVNAWVQLDDATTKIVSDQKKSSGNAVCEHCFRTFNDMSKARLHEKKCPRNPCCKTAGDPFHLSSVYREIRPPPPIIAEIEI
mmetsp:Transcript_31023/g.47036  ORF Transcript_31023/g.47036 Transcript_31023/m.47036 type:complete len:390 (-) Transcript_31023:54-1223(-)